MIDETILKKLRMFFKINRRAPSYQEIAHIFGYSSKNAAFKLIQKLIVEGILSKDENGKIIPKSLFEVPMLGRIRAGFPIMAEPTVGERLDLYDFLLNVSGSTFALTVRGDSMSDAGIHEGDIVIIDIEKRFRMGDIVAAVVDNEWTIKYIEEKDGDICLVPANPEYPVIYPKENLTIGGVVTTVIRKYK